MEPTLVEVCIGSVEDAKAAELAGADRVELCGATEVGGLTPSAGLIEAVTESTSLPVMVMIRPRPGGFCYSDAEYDTALRDLKAALKFDVAGVVFGFLHRDGSIDEDRCQNAVAMAAGKQTVFHRAFDVVPDPIPAIDQLIGVGVTRILTSGQCANALQGAPLIRQLRDQANDQIEILPGGGIRAENVGEILRVTECTQVHVGASGVQCDNSLMGNSEIDFFTSDYLESGRHRIVDQNSVAAVMRELGR